MMLDPPTIERMAAKAGDGPILIALSGGGDSVALLHLMHDAFGAERLRAAVVDHALRDGSASEAGSAAQFAADLNVPSRVVRLSWAEGENRAHEALRERRYGALCEEARRVGAQIIATGHTRDDQAETVLLRAERQSGWRGLAGMRAFASVPLWPEGRGLWLARPLLRMRREGLRNVLRERGARWLEDPSNANQNYARVRARARLAALRSNGLDTMRLAALAERLAPHAASLDEQAWSLIEREIVFEGGSIVFGRAEWLNGDETCLRVLSVLLAAAGAQDRGPASGRLAELCRAMRNSEFSGATLAGALVRAQGAAIVLSRDRGALEGRADGTPPLAPVALPPGEEVVWDRRLALISREPGWSVVVENDAARLARGEERADLAAASPHWLLRTRAQHLLDRG